jgi:hypothetical protein
MTTLEAYQEFLNSKIEKVQWGGFTVVSEYETKFKDDWLALQEADAEKIAA